MRVADYGAVMYQLKQVGAKCAQYFEEVRGISLVRYRLVTFLEAGAANQQTISQHLGIDQAAVTRHLKRLEDDGWVQRERDPANQRQVVVTVTDRARQALADCEAEGTDALAQAFLGTDELAQLQALLDTLDARLDVQLSQIKKGV